jgi:ribosomal protein S18 acetylase RimI-like enzyme
MSRLDLLPISRADHRLLAELMKEEELAWMSDLRWDYSPVRHILQTYIDRNLLPGYVAINGSRALGYAYFLLHQHKGIIGTIYASKSAQSQMVSDEILAAAIECLKDTAAIQRIEAQIMPFHGINPTAMFTRHGFQCYERYFLELDLANYAGKDIKPTAGKIIPWDSAYLAQVAEVTLSSYQNQIDAVLSEDYSTLAGCDGYLRSLMDTPGCGSFLPAASAIGLDEHGAPCGFIIASKISSFAGMVPQISCLPAAQGRGLGKALIHHAISHFRLSGCRTVCLTVTKKNGRAFEWYERLGFKIRKDFGAYIWHRP